MASTAKTRVPRFESFPSKKYQTSSGIGHRFIPNVAQDFDCRVKSNVKPTYKDIAIKNEEFKTVYRQEFPSKIDLKKEKYKPPQHNEAVDFVKNVEEKLIQNVPVMFSEMLSETKDSFKIKYSKPLSEDRNSTEDTVCFISKVGSEQQPPISVHHKGSWKWMDPYLTTNRFHYTDHVNKSDDEICTFYNQTKFNLQPASGNKVMFDKTDFANVLPIRIMPKLQRKIPNYGMQSEYADHYKKHFFSDLSPYIHQSGAEFDDVIMTPDSWQNLVAPGMYCSEYCTIGRGSVRRVVDPNMPKRIIVRTQGCDRLEKN